MQAAFALGKASVTCCKTACSSCQARGTQSTPAEPHPWWCGATVGPDLREAGTEGVQQSWAAVGRPLVCSGRQLESTMRAMMTPECRCHACMRSYLIQKVRHTVAHGGAFLVRAAKGCPAGRQRHGTRTQQAVPQRGQAIPTLPPQGACNSEGLPTRPLRTDGFAPAPTGSLPRREQQKALGPGGGGSSPKKNPRCYLATMGRPTPVTAAPRTSRRGLGNPVGAQPRLPSAAVASGKAGRSSGVQACRSHCS